MNFKLHAPFKPTGDQPAAIDSLTGNLQKGRKNQVLLGVTGSGKTFTMANVIAKLNRPTLIISHNKTLAAQLYQEFRDFFPENAVSYFVSYYDFYQPEAYIPQSDTYIEKETEINEKIDTLRLAATANLLSRRDTIVVASVSAIYNLGSPEEYGHFILELRTGMKLSRESVITRLIDLQYARSQMGFHRSTFRVRGDSIDIFLAYEESAVRIVMDDVNITGLAKIDPLTGKITDQLNHFTVYPAKHYVTDPHGRDEAFSQIRSDLETQVRKFKAEGKLVEAQRLNQRVNFDLEMITEAGYVNGIENYSRYFDGRKPGDPPFSLMDYFRTPYKDDWLMFIDESHMTIPQIRGMYNGDRSRKMTLVDFGFRLPAALDNRPLTFSEFMHRSPQTVYVSATPTVWEISLARENAYGSKKMGTKASDTGIIEQLIRPTGIIDPEIIIKPSSDQITDLTREIIMRRKKKERVLVTTLTKKMAEDLARYLSDHKFREDPEFKSVPETDFPDVEYLHSDIQTLQRSDILDKLRSGKYDVLVGINLLREGLDLPEVSLVAILDADKEGFLRSETSLVQTMGRAARHISGTVIMYADVITGSMERAIAEIKRRRIIQIKYNKKHHITPVSISKPIREKLIDQEAVEPELSFLNTAKRVEYRKLLDVDISSLTPFDSRKLINKMTREMRAAALEMNFELAAELRDKINDLNRV